MGPLGIGVPLVDPGGPPALAHVLPLNRDSIRKPLSSAAVAAIFVTTTDAATQLPASTIAALFGLTPTEGRVMIEIAEGRNRAETASALSIAAGTVKSHLERIFEKTGATSQTELALIVKRLTPPVRS